MKIIASDDHRQHAPEFELAPGAFNPIFEIPDRAEIVLRSLQEHEVGTVIAPSAQADDAMLQIHERSYVEFLQTAHDDYRQLGGKGNPTACVWPRGNMRSDSSDSIIAKFGRYCFDGAVPITESTYEAVIASRDIALTATKQVYDGDRAAFALCRPPGHHAGPSYAGGYCYLNNAAIAAQWLLNNNVSQVAILDIDYHHGNGTQEIFYERGDVAFVSIHCDPNFEYPYYAGHEDEKGRGDGEGFNLNLPLPRKTGLDAWLGVLNAGISFIQSTSPDYLIVSLGVDTFENDPIASFRIRTGDYRGIGKRIAEMELPTIFIFEGGYAVSELGENVAALLSGFEASF
ncbi:MAG: histone deacetylase family protein [Pseudomonadota bacterium]